MDKTISKSPSNNNNQPKDKLIIEKFNLLDAIYVAPQAQAFNNNDQNINPYNSEVLAKVVVNFPQYNRALMMYKSPGYALDPKGKEIISPYANTTFKIVKQSEIGLDHVKISNFIDNFVEPAMKEHNDENVLFEANNGFQIARPKNANPELVLEYIKFQPKNLNYTPMSKKDISYFAGADAKELIYQIIEESDILDVNVTFNSLYQQIVTKIADFDKENNKIHASNTVLDIEDEYEKVAPMSPLVFAWSYRKELKEMVTAKEVMELKDDIEKETNSSITITKNQVPKLNARQIKAFYVLKLSQEKEKQLRKAGIAHTNPHHFNDYMNQLDQELQFMERAFSLLESNYGLKLNIQFEMEESDQTEMDR